MKPGTSKSATGEHAAWHGLLAAVGVALWLGGCSTAPKPVMPDGKLRIPVNTAARIEAFQERLEEMRGYEADRARWAQEVGELRNQVAQLRSATMILAANAEERAGAPLALRSGAPGAGRLAIADLHSMPLGVPPALALNDATQPMTVLQAPAVSRTSGSLAARSAPAVRLAPQNEQPIKVRVFAPPGDAAGESKSAATGEPAAPGQQATEPPPRPASPARLDYDSRQLEFGRPQQVPISIPRELTERIELAEAATEAPQESFSFTGGALATGFDPDSAIADALISAARRSVRVVIRSSVSAAPNDLVSFGRARERANQARAWLVAKGLDPMNIYLTTTRKDLVADDSARPLFMRIDVESTRQTASREDSLPAVSPGGRSSFREMGLTRIAVGVQ